MDYLYRFPGTADIRDSEPEVDRDLVYNHLEEDSNSVPGGQFPAQAGRRHSGRPSWIRRTLLPGFPGRATDPLAVFHLPHAGAQALGVGGGRFTADAEKIIFNTIVTAGRIKQKQSTTAPDNLTHCRYPLTTPPNRIAKFTTN